MYVMAGKENKNVIFLVLDSLRKDRVSPYNDEIDFTEKLEEISNHSQVYTDAVTQAPWSLPSHGSMFTGEYPWDHNATQVHSYLSDDKKTFISDFNEEGYETSVITVNNWITPHKGLAKDFHKVENFFKTADNSLAIKFLRISTKLWDKIDISKKKVLGRQIDRFFRFFGVDDSCKSEETVKEVSKYLDNIGDEDFFLYVNLK
jgi:choline-sulfatase